MIGDMNDKELEKKLEDFAEVILSYFEKEKYIKKLSTRKLIELANKVLWKDIKLWSVQENIYDEMIARLEQKAEVEEAIYKMIPE